MPNIGKGIFTRTRFDFLVQNAMIGATHNPNTAKGTNTRIGLQNNDTLGRPIALYALLVYCPFNPPIVFGVVEPEKGTAVFPTGQNGGQSPLFANAQNQPGQVRYDATGAITDEFNYVFIATGDKWIHLDGAPIAIIPPLWMFALWPAQMSADLYGTFLWGMLEDKAAGSI